MKVSEHKQILKKYHLLESEIMSLLFLQTKNIN